MVMAPRSHAAWAGALGILLGALSCTVSLDPVPRTDGGARSISDARGQGGQSGGQGGRGGAGSAPGSGGSAIPGTGGSAAVDPAGIPLTVVVDPPGGTFATSQRVTLTAPGGGTIHYTLDGSLPTTASPIYSAALDLRTTTILRTFATTGGPTATMAAASFMQVSPELTTWSSNLPVVVLHTHQRGMLPAVAESPFVNGSMLALAPGPGGRTPLVGAASTSARAGLRVRGQSSVTFPQKSYSVEMREAGSDQDGARALLGLSRESDFALVGAAMMDRSLIRNAVAYALSTAMGRWAPRTRFVEAFVVEHGGPVTRANYRGVYTLAETIKRDGNRVDVAKLEATSLEAPLITGGYIVRIDKGPAHFTAGGHRFQYVYPDWVDIGMSARSRQRSYFEGYLREFFEALARPDYKHPTTGKHYRDYIDVPAFIDHNLLNAVMKNVDALRISAYFHKPLGGPLRAGPVWDFDRSSGTPYDDPEYSAPRALEPREWVRDDATHHLEWGFWARLFADPAFKAAYVQRLDELTGGTGPLSVGRIHAVIDGLNAQLTEAQARHFARWPEMPAMQGSHAAEVTALKSWFAARIPWMQEQL